MVLDGTRQLRAQPAKWQGGLAEGGKGLEKVQLGVLVALVVGLRGGPSGGQK